MLYTGLFDVRAQLKPDGAENELVIRVGASIAQLPLHLNDGWDNEKSRYIPGIYDSVELILCGSPHVVNVQTVANVEQRSVRAAVELAVAAAPAAIATLKAVVREAKSGRVAGEMSLDTAGACGRKHEHRRICRRPPGRSSVDA